MVVVRGGLTPDGQLRNAPLPEGAFGPARHYSEFFAGCDSCAAIPARRGLVCPRTVLEGEDACQENDARSDGPLRPSELDAWLAGVLALALARKGRGRPALTCARDPRRRRPRVIAKSTPTRL